MHAGEVVLHAIRAAYAAAPARSTPEWAAFDTRAKEVIALGLEGQLGEVAAAGPELGALFRGWAPAKEKGKK